MIKVRIRALTHPHTLAVRLIIRPGVMSGIITAPAFNNVFTATKDKPAMQGFVTAIYEIGIYPFHQTWRIHLSRNRVPLWGYLHPWVRRLPRSPTVYDARVCYLAISKGIVSN